MRKKSQIGEIFIYLISTLIIILVLYYGYKAIQNIGKKQQELSFVKFQTGLTDMISYTSSDYGTVRVESFDIPAGFKEVCIVDPYLVKTGNATTISEVDYPLMHDSVADSVQANIFVLPGGNPFYVERVFVENASRFICYPVLRGKITVRIEGLGDRAKIS